MIAELYANMCGIELWNRARLARYMANGVGPSGLALRCEPCEGLEELIPCLDDGPPDHDAPLADEYQLPELDAAPWYDAAVPESKNFAGMLVLETKMSQPVDRRMVQAVGSGAVLTRARYQGRELYVRGLLIGKTCCAADYGLRWLTQALLGEYCGGCDGCLLTFLTCGPSTVSGDACLSVLEESGQRVPYFRAPESDEMTRGTDFVRQMYGTGLLQGPEVLGQRGGGHCVAGGCGCAPLTEVEFTIGVGNPWLYHLEELVVDEVGLTACPPLHADWECQVVFDVGTDCDPFDPCAQQSGCDEDPDCEQFPNPPPSGSFPVQECGCIPLVVERTSALVPSAQDWLDQALIVEVSAGSQDVRNMLIQAWTNPMGLDCADPANLDYFADCNACAQLLVGFVPAGGVLRFDSAAREVTVTCGGVTKQAQRHVGTPQGLPFEWMEVGCQQVCVGIEVDCENASPDATVSIWRVGKEL